MVLKLTLKPYERFVVNGCALRNSGRKHSLVVEEKADIIRGKDLLDPSNIATPSSKAYFMLQIALTRADVREELVPLIQKLLAQLATVFGPPNVQHIFEAANYVSKGDYYKAMCELRPVMQYEKELVELIREVRKENNDPELSETEGLAS